MPYERLTFEETRLDLSAKLLLIEQKQKKEKNSIEEMGDLFPVGVLINSKQGENLYMNKISEEILGYTAEETREMGEKYVQIIQYDKIEANRILQQINAFFQRNDETAFLNCFQRLTPSYKKSYDWMYISSRLIKDHKEDTATKRLLVACPVNQMGEMNKKVNRVLEENAYMKKNFKRYAALTKREKEILSLVARGYESKEIAKMLFISRYTVEQHRKNLNAKLEPSSYAELIKFALAFDLMD